MDHIWQEWLRQALAASPWPVLHSRVHPVPAWGPGLWLKRDDELGFGITGCKLRKVAALAAHWCQHNYDQVLACGGAYSHHLAALLQALHETEQAYHLWLGPVRDDQPPQGSRALLQLLIRESAVTHLNRDEWRRVAELMAERQATLEASGQKVLIIREGGCQLEALWGAMTLATDVLRNEREVGCEFDQIFIDAGTGLTAIGLYLGLWCLGRKPTIHLILMADNETAWQQRRQELQAQWLALTGLSLASDEAPRVVCHRPVTAAAFGAVNAAVRREVREAAQTVGVLLDPIYTAKLVMTAKAIRGDDGYPRGEALVIHSGGGWSLTGFWSQLLV